MDFIDIFYLCFPKNVKKYVQGCVLCIPSSKINEKYLLFPLKLEMK